MSDCTESIGNILLFLATVVASVIGTIMSYLIIWPDGVDLNFNFITLRSLYCAALPSQFIEMADPGKSQHGPVILLGRSLLVGKGKGIVLADVDLNTAYSISDLGSAVLVDLIFGAYISRVEVLKDIDDLGVCKTHLGLADGKVDVELGGESTRKSNDLGIVGVRQVRW